MGQRLINVGIAETAFSVSPDILRTVLGSCVSICLYDPSRRAGGLAHIILPEISTDSGPPRKYADSAIPILIAEVISAGGIKKNLVAKIAGGANMFRLKANSFMAEIGGNNILKVKEVLRGAGINLIGEDVGGEYGRTVDFFLESGAVKVKSLSGKSIII